MLSMTSYEFARLMLQEENRTVSETVLDQGTVWWLAGLTDREKVRVVFNLALQVRPSEIPREDYETRAPIDLEVVDIERSGARDWALYTAATLRVLQSAQQGQSFRWRAWGER
jgi:hypothetical protein